MIFFKKHKGIITVAFVMAVLLAISFFVPATPDTGKVPDEANPLITTDATTPSTKGTQKSDDTHIEPKTDTEVEEANPDEPSSDDRNNNAADKLTCTLSVTCHTILDNMHKVKEEKKQIIPLNGIIYPQKRVEFYENETAFNVLLREMKQNRIHFEYEYTPMYDSIYIEGIGNIYEFDAGDLSGWLYRVNGSFLNYSLSEYTLKNGDKIEIIYTCNMGADVGGAYPSLQ